MAITYELEEKEGIVRLRLSGPPTMDEYQATFPQALEQIEATNIDKWLVILDYEEPATDAKDVAFTEYLFNQQLNRYIHRMAVVCPLQLYSRVKNVLEPIKNQGKPVELFQSIDEARDWLLE